jgi:hypothetical protein
MIYNNISCHKHATVFMNPVKEDIAPGYRNIVHRPMDLTTIKKNLENGTIKTTIEFQRDIMLMFTNALMYNSSNHDIHKITLEMYREVVNDIEQLLNAQEIMSENGDVPTNSSGIIGLAISKPFRNKEMRSSTASDRATLLHQNSDNNVQNELSSSMSKSRKFK